MLSLTRPSIRLGSGLGAGRGDESKTHTTVSTGWLKTTTSLTHISIYAGWPESEASFLMLTIEKPAPHEPNLHAFCKLKVSNVGPSFFLSFSFDVAHAPFCSSSRTAMTE